MAGKFLQGLGQISSGLISGIGSAAGAYIQAKQSGKNIAQQAMHNRQLAEYQYGKDLEMWKRANAYNTPTEQMARLRAAGLNPALMYKGAPQNVASAQLPKYQQVKTDYSQRQNPMQALATLGMYQDFRLKQAQTDNVEKQGELLRSEADHASYYYRYRRGIAAERMDALGRQRAIELGLEGHWKDIRQNKVPLKGLPMKKMYQYQLQGKEAQVRNIEQQIKLRTKQTDWYVFNLLSKLGLSAGRTAIGALGIGKLGKATKGLGKIQRYTGTTRYRYPATNRRW